MDLLQSPKEYLYNLHTSSSSEAKRMWKQSIKEKWNNKCAYCESTENLTIDHIVPQSKGGLDLLENVVCCCKSCNSSKGHIDWKDWYKSQSFFNEERFNTIMDWTNVKKNSNLYSYRPRRNNAS